VLVTTDRNIHHQQNLTRRTIAIIVLDKASWPLIKSQLPKVAGAVAASTPGSLVDVDIPTA
jgi:hypothetical protein